MYLNDTVLLHCRIFLYRIGFVAHENDVHFQGFLAMSLENTEIEENSFGFIGQMMTSSGHPNNLQGIYNAEKRQQHASNISVDYTIQEKNQPLDVPLYDLLRSLPWS